MMKAFIPQRSSCPGSSILCLEKAFSIRDCGILRHLYHTLPPSLTHQGSLKYALIASRILVSLPICSAANIYFDSSRLALTVQETSVLVLLGPSWTYTKQQRPKGLPTQAR